MITIHFDIEPYGKKRPRFGNGRAYTPAKTRAYEQTIQMIARASGARPMQGALKVRAVFYCFRPKKLTHPYPCQFDLDNFLKALTDPLNGVCWIDDRQIAEIHSKKVYAEPGQRSGILLEVTSLGVE